MSFDAEMRIYIDDPSGVSLYIQGQIPIPDAQFDESIPEGFTFDHRGVSWPGNVNSQYYHGKVAVSVFTPVVGAINSRVATIPSSGRGQMRFFDQLVGERLAAFRLEQGRELRRAFRDGHPDTKGVYPLKVTEAEVARISELVEGFFESGDSDETSMVILAPDHA